jgi:uncharacterized membrane protein
MRPAVGVAFVIASASSCSAEQKNSYALTVLPQPVAGFVAVSDIDKKGRVLYGVRDQQGNDRPFLWSDGVVTALPLPIGAPRGIARTMSDDGLIGGSTGPFSNLSATLWRDGQPERINPFDTDLSDIMWVSPSGNICGYARPFQGQTTWHGWAIIDGEFHDMGPMPFHDVSAGNVINDAGLVAGSWENERGRNVPFLWDAEHGVRELPSLGGVVSQVRAMNNAGVVVGSSSRGTNDAAVPLAAEVPVKWDENGRITTLARPAGFPTGLALAVSESGHVVGYANNFGTGASVALLWIDDDMVVLQDVVAFPESGWTLRTATGINDSGQIIGIGRRNGVDFAVLLTPQ